MQELVLRPATDHDADRLADFLNTCTLRHQGVARSSSADARSGLNEHGADPSTDSRLALSGEEIVGFARVWAASDEELRSYARTHPDRTGRGVGTALLEFCEHRAGPPQCYCRKPMPGLGAWFIEKYKLNPPQCIMVGDLKSDLTFAMRCGFTYVHPDVFFA